MIPDLILGAGPSGLMIGHRLTQLGRPFLILERGESAMAKTGDGFFYLHEPITGNETAFKIYVTSCPGADEKVYAQKVYGDPMVGPVSIKKQSGNHVGYQLDPAALLGPVAESVLPNTDVAFIDTENRIVFSKTGNSWPYRRLHSTIPLPIFAKMMPRGPHVRFHSRPIWIESKPLASAGPDLQPMPKEMRCHYCPGSCHDWYRATARGMKVQYERMEKNVYGSYPLHPGKIWLDPANRADEEEELNQYRFYLEAKDIFLWGRYASWRPKHLLHMVWAELKTKLS